MKTLDLELTRIGNSRGVRLPVALIKRYGFSGPITVEAREDGLLLKPKKQSKLSWEETAREMAASGEDWSDWNNAGADGLESCPWEGPVPPEIREWARASAARERHQRQAARKRNQR